MAPVLLALASAILFAFSLPPYNLEWLGWFALAPLLVAVQGRRALEAIGLGLITGVVCGVLHSGWSRNSITVLFGFVPFLWLTFLFAGVAAVSRMRGADGSRWILWVTVVGITGEWLTTFLPIPVNTGLCMYQQTSLIQIASITGIWGVSLLVWLSNATIADAIIDRRLITRRVAPVAMAVLLCYAGGALVLSRAHHTARPVLHVAAIQDFTGDETHEIVPEPVTTVDREAMTRQAVASGAQMAVWSEEALGSGFAPDRASDPTRALARTSNAYLVVGHSAQAPMKSYNCASLISPNGDVLGVYHKVHLYLGESQNIVPGDRGRTFVTPTGVVGMEVCFDSCYTDVTRQEAAAGAQLIAMPNFDPPTPRGVLHYLHASMLPFRAVENHVGFIRADSNGLSQIISPNGEVLAQGNLYAPGIVTARIPLSDGRGTVFTRCGDWLAYLCAGAVAVLSLIRPKRPQSPPIAEVSRRE